MSTNPCISHKQDVTIQLFWKVLASLSQEEQSGFVRFAWGRSRLPPKHAWFKDMQVRARVASIYTFAYILPSFVRSPFS